MIFEWYFITLVFVFGSIIGSFLNVVIYRFHTGKSLAGHSHCLSCLKPLLWYELFPLLSYLCLRGRCRGCSSYIPPRYFIVELLTGLAFVSVLLLGESVMEMFLMAILLTLLIVVAVYDVYHYVIPNEFVILVSFIALSYQGLYLYEGAAVSTILIPAASAAAAFLFFGGLWKVSKGRWLGFGDAKLALPLGFMAGFPAVFSMIILSFWIGAVVSVLLLSVQWFLKRGKVTLRFFGVSLTMKSEVPFAPFLIMGFILSALYGVDVLFLVAHVF